jgi:hypothetical protein
LFGVRSTVTLEPVAFLGRFIEHVLPSGFRKLRHYGLLAPANISTLFDAVHTALIDASAGNVAAQPARTALPAATDWRAVLELLTGIDLGVCPLCGACTVERHPLPPARAPPQNAA